MSKPSHTRTPWKVYTNIPAGSLDLRTSEAMLISGAHPNVRGVAVFRYEADARLAARAVLAHDVLVEAVEDLLQAAKCHAMLDTQKRKIVPRDGCDCWGCTSARKAHVALKKAEI